MMLELPIHQTHSRRFGSHGTVDYQFHSKSNCFPLPCGFARLVRLASGFLGLSSRVLAGPKRKLHNDANQPETSPNFAVVSAPKPLRLQHETQTRMESPLPQLIEQHIRDRPVNFCFRQYRPWSDVAKWFADISNPPRRPRLFPGFLVLEEASLIHPARRITLASPFPEKRVPSGPASEGLHVHGAGESSSGHLICFTVGVVSSLPSVLGFELHSDIYMPLAFPWFPHFRYIECTVAALQVVGTTLAAHRTHRRPVPVSGAQKFHHRTLTTGGPWQVRLFLCHAK